MHAIHWKKQAINDLIGIGQYIARDSPSNAVKMMDFIADGVKPLAMHPHIGRAGRKRGTYELVVHKNTIS